MKKDAILGFGQNRAKTLKLGYFDTILEFVYGKVFGFLGFGQNRAKTGNLGNFDPSLDFVYGKVFGFLGIC
jgi:hypothetical protein